MELNVVPWTWKDCYHQQCYASCVILKQLGAHMGQYVLITIQKKAYICSLWPKADIGSRNFSFCDIVSYRTSEYSSDIERQLKLLFPSKAKVVYVSVILTTIEKVIQTKKDEQSMKTLHQQVLNLLQRLCVCCKAVISCKDSQLAKLVGVNYINIEEVHVSHTKQCFQEVVIDPKTEIKIQDVHSLDWYKQLNGVIEIKKPGGLESVLNMLKDLIQLPLTQKQAFDDIGAQAPRGILLRGPPGCGKTSLVRYLAMAENVFLVAVNGPEIFGPLPGETEGNLRKLFDKAKLRSTEGPCILFIDEVDSICPKGGKSGGLHETRATAQLVLLMDRLKDENFLIIAATNRHSAIDPALRRPGRFDREVSCS